MDSPEVLRSAFGESLSFVNHPQYKGLIWKWK